MKIDNLQVFVDDLGWSESDQGRFDAILKFAQEATWRIQRLDDQILKQRDYIESLEAKLIEKEVI